MKKITSADIMRLFPVSARRSHSLKDIQRMLRISSRERSYLRTALDQLLASGQLVLLGNRRYAVPRRGKCVAGELSVHPDGFGFVATPGRDDIYVSGRDLHGAIDGDQVSVVLGAPGRSGRLRGRVDAVLSRKRAQLVGRYYERSGTSHVIPDDPRMSQPVMIAADQREAARDGLVVVAEILPPRAGTVALRGKIIEVLGDPADPAIEMIRIARRFELPTEFPAEVIMAAAQIASVVKEEELAGRRDLRHLPLVTIDGESAKDFDDAVLATREADGNWRLLVAIADVAHYVDAGGVIDLEARRRGTSAYFPAACLPMLPEALSNGICSLQPGVDRLALVAEILLSASGETLAARFDEAVIRSQARLTYTDVFACLSAAVVREAVAQLRPQLTLMAELAGRLERLRRRRGSIDFDLPEAEIILDLRGRPEQIIRSERTIAHGLIEEFMLVANEAAAKFLVDHQFAVLYRVHEPPTIAALDQFREFSAYLNYGLAVAAGDVTPLELQQLLASAAGQPEAHILHRALLRAMRQARYSPEPLGHFGLALSHYCHFTSPIRRYPDLFIHRQLRAALRGATCRYAAGKELARLGEETSLCERRAMEAERDMLRLKKCQFLAEHTGNQFAGVISSVQPFGFFVELEMFLIDGLIKIADLDDDYYLYEAERQRLVGTRRRRIFALGDPCRVTVTQVDIDRRQIDFSLVVD
ncbi:MAG: ribonuclease R [Desulfuromonadaceae bacterium]|nr:ribonuclease R [Desulfuromonadaceae bacterium]